MVAMLAIMALAAAPVLAQDGSASGGSASGGGSASEAAEETTAPKADDLPTSGGVSLLALGSAAVLISGAALGAVALRRRSA